MELPEIVSDEEREMLANRAHWESFEKDLVSRQRNTFRLLIFEICLYASGFFLLASAVKTKLSQ